MKQHRGKSALSIVRHYYPNVSKVTDAKDALIVNVTNKDCRSGEQKDPNHCAMAKACEREWDGAIISMSVAYMVRGNHAYRYTVPQSIARELVSFDRNKDFREGEYWLNAPSGGRRLGSRKHPQPKDKGKYGRHKQRVHRTEGLRSL